MKKVTKSIITSSLLALAFGAMSVGTTFALFTSKAETTINVESGVIDLKAPISVVSAWELGPEPMIGSGFSYQNSIGGSITKDENNIVHLNKLAPGDGAIFALTPNNSGTNIKTKARLVVTLEGDLAGALNVEVKAGEDMVIGFNGAHTGYTPWEEVNVGENPTAFNVKVEFPDGDNGEILFGEDNHDNQYQNKTATLVIGYEAVQGNAQTDDMLQIINNTLMSKAYQGSANKTMYDALQDLSTSQVAAIQERGYVWSVEEDQFYNFTALPTAPYKFFKMCNSMPTSQDYSIYAYGDSWAGTTINPLTVGFDAGETTGITSITYDRQDASVGQEVTIRTNGGNLTINAPLDIVHHYGDVGVLSIEAVANASYHEFGKAKFVEIKTGRMALERTAEVEHIHLATSEIQQEAVFNNITISKAKDVEMPDFSRDPVTIPAEGRLVVALQEGTEDITAQTELDYVWLTAVGIYEQVVMSDQKEDLSATSAVNSFAADSTDAEKKVAAQQIANNITAIVGDEEYTLAATTTDGGETWTYTLESGTSADDITENVTVAVEENVATVSVGEDEKTTKTENGISSEEKESAINQATLVGSGDGSQANPYVIANADEWKALCDLCFYDSGYSETDGKYYEVTSDIDVSGYGTKYPSNPNGCVKYFAGHIDFNNHIVSGFNKTNGSVGSLFSYVGGSDALIENLSLETTTIHDGSGTVWAFSLTDCLYGNVTIKNANIFGNASGINTNNNGLFAEYVGYGNGGYGHTYNYVFENCTNYANLTGTKLTAAFIGASGFANNGNLEFRNCRNYGTIISTGDSASMLISNCTYFKWGGLTNIIVENCQNLSTIIGAKAQYATLLSNGNTGDYVYYTQYSSLNGVRLDDGNGSFLGLAAGQTKINEILAEANALTGSQPAQLSVGQIATENNMFVLNETENAVRYELAFSFSSANRNGGGAGYTFKFTDTLPDDIMVGSWLTKSEAEDTGKEIVEHNQYGTTFYTCDGSYVYYEEGARFHSEPRVINVFFIAYGANDAVLSVSSYVYGA